MARRAPPDTTHIDAYRRWVKEALRDGLPVDVDTPTRERVYRSAGWQAALALRESGKPPSIRKKRFVKTPKPL
jgi:hypothetical protein